MKRVIQWVGGNWTLWVPFGWLIVTAAGFVWYVRVEDLGRSDQIAAAQVATGIAGVGAAIVALLGIRQQLKPQRADLRLRVTMAGPGRCARLLIRNRRPVPAHDVAIVFEGVGFKQVVAPDGIAPWTAVAHRETGAHMLVRNMFPAETDDSLVSPGEITFPADRCVAISVECLNGTGHRFPLR